MELQEIIDFNKPYNELNINTLIDAIKSNSIVPYIGAGMSILYENIYPSWNVFLWNTFNQYLHSEDANEFDAMSHEDKAEFLYHKVGKISFPEHLKMTFGEKLLDIGKIDFFNKPAYMLPIIFGDGLLLTTNYDKVIEKIYNLHGKTLTVAHPGHYEAFNRALRDRELLLFKIHGDIMEPESSIILTKEQYNFAYQKPDLINTLSQTYKSKKILFLGCSLSKDRPIDLLGEILTPGMKNYAIISCKKEEMEEKRLQLENELSTQSIIYPEGKHECLKVLLDHIAANTNPVEFKRAMEKNHDKKAEDLCFELTEEWFINQNKIQIKNLGDRYLPDLNVELKIKDIFDALSRNADFYGKLFKITDEVLIALKDLKLEGLNESIMKISSIIKDFNINSIEPFLVEDLLNEIDTMLSVIDEEISVSHKEMYDKSSTGDREIQSYIYKLNQAYNDVYDYKDYLNSSEINAVNNPYLLLYGEGGIGKSHMIADIIMKRNSDGKKSLLLLGQHFKGNKNPLIDILNMLELDCSTEQFLNELNRVAEENKSRIVIFIDAINEGNGKNIWKDYLGGIVEKIKLFPWLGLVMSVRTEYVDPLFADNRALKTEIIKVEHTGFSTLEYEAILKYFDYYNIQFTDIPFSEQEFRNPLFLRLLCEGFKNKRVNLSDISITDVYSNYLDSINLSISEICGYSRHIKVVEEVIKEMALYKHNAGVGNNFISINNAIQIIIGIEQKYNIRKPLIDELLSNGVITQNTNYNDEECIYVTYEKLDDYLYAKLLYDELKNIGVEEFRIKYRSLQRYGDILEALSIVLSEDSKYELFEIFEEEKADLVIINSFCSSLKWRKQDAISQRTIDYINNVVLRSEDGFERLFDVLILVSTKVGYSLNAEDTVEYILNYPMADRDAIFIPLFDDIYYEEGSSINRLLDWCLFKNINGSALEETVRLTAIMVSTFLISPNNKLRDKATKALVHLLSGRINVLISVMEKYKDVDDPYIIERLYAVGFGCVVSEQNNDMTEKLALYVYDAFFKNEYIYPNMLVRDYAKNIIEYAKYKVSSSKLISLNVEPPYKSDMPAVPTDDEINKYKVDYNKEGFRDYYWSQNAILSSMKVEYNRQGGAGGYGDFGRYTFQSYFSNWYGLDYNDLKNIAIKKIFDMGYDVEKHGKYDREIDRARYRNDSLERIGKKYQWIALYELAAQVADNYKMNIYTDCYGKKDKIYCKGSFEPNLRNIDPTVLFHISNNKPKQIHNKLYTLPSIPNNEWLSTFDDLPSFDKMVELTYNNKDYILLNGWYIWQEEKELGVEKYQNPHKDMWIQINCYIVKEKTYEKVIDYLKDKDFIGRWLSEPNENYHLFNKEYYWSDAYFFYKNPYYCGDDWMIIDQHGTEEGHDLEVLIPTSKYMTERRGDLVYDNRSSAWYKPSEEIFEGLNMRYGKENSILYDAEGNIICFDSKELLNEDIGFFIDKDLFFKYIKKKGYRIFWTVLSEKRIIKEVYNDKDKYKSPRVSGLYTTDGDEYIVKRINLFED